MQRLLRLLRDQDPLSQEQMQGLCIELNDFIVALAEVQPSAKREGFVTVPNVTWADIGALEDIREELIMAILVGILAISVIGHELRSILKKTCVHVYQIILFKNSDFYFVCVSILPVCIFVYMHTPSTGGCQKVPYPLELEL